MRQVFTSPRIENVEAVARLLREHGVEVRVSNGRGWRGAIRGNFSYREQAARGPQPEVWVLRSEDYPKARQLLRDAGLPQGGQHVSAYGGPSMHAATVGERAAAARRPGSRARTGALLAVALAVAGGYFALRWSASQAPSRAQAAAPPTARPASSPLVADASTEHAIPTPPALAAMLLAAPSLRLPDTACITLDGGVPPPEVLDAARGRVGQDCAADAPRVEIGPWRTDGSGAGDVQVAIAAHGASRQVSTFEVERRRDDWRIVREVDVADPR